jgi:hypothetical protein
MTAILKRVARLEGRFGNANGKPQLLFIVHSAGWGLALDGDTCLQILRDSGFVPSPTGFVNLCDVPDGLNVEATQRFLRERAAEICFPQPRRSDHAAQASGNGSAR